MTHGSINSLKNNFCSDRRHNRPKRPQALHRGGLPLRLREDQPSHDDAHPAGVQGGVRGRRHRMDEVRQQRSTEGHQP